MADTNEQIRLARIELAKRELSRRQSATTDNRRFDQKLADFVQPVSDVMGKAGEAAGVITDVLHPESYFAGKAAESMNKIADTIGEKTTEYLSRGKGAIPGAPAAALGMGASILSNPTSYVAPELGYSSKLGPAVGKPGIASRIKQMRTGVEASAFEQLRRDPTAFFNRTPRAEAGEAVGQAKVNAGINPGVTKDPASLTSENMQKARSPMVSANKAQDQIVEDLQAARELLGPGASMDKLVETAGITPDQTATALKGLNKRLTKIERSEGRGSESFRDFAAIKDHFQNILENVAPEVKAANKDFSRVALRDKFMEPFPVNQAGTMSKISTFGGAPVAGGVGAVLGGPVGAAVGAVAFQAARSPFVAGLGTAVRGLADKAIDPLISGTVNQMGRRAGPIGQMVSPKDKDEAYRKFIESRKRK
jgi:hypothetical protein